MNRLSLITLEEQPDFPASDLSDMNAEMIGEYYLPHTPGLEQEARRLQLYQRQLFEAALIAFALTNMPVRLESSPDTYIPFTEGFASYELIQLLVTSSAYDVERAVSRFQALYLSAGIVDLPARIETWPDVRPNIYRTVLSPGIGQGASNAQLHARALGAQIAFELQRPILDAA
jgi:hypothetical protein